MAKAWLLYVICSMGTERDNYFAGDEQWTSDCGIAPTGALHQTRQLAVDVRLPRQCPRYWGEDPSCEPLEGGEVLA
jgi:hypothetical protein